MRECIQKILDEVDSEIATLDIDDCDVITNSLAMVTRLENILKELREQVINYTFASKEEEISFFIMPECGKTNFVGHFQCF